MNPRFLLAVAGALFLPLASAANDSKALRDALTLHASFDDAFNADFSRGDSTLYAGGGGASGPAKETDAIKLEPNEGRFGGALHVLKKNPMRPYFKGPGILDYKAANWSGTVSVWLRLTPDEDLEPGYCDPVQIIAGDAKKGFIFLEWSRDERPRLFRFAIRPVMELWNPTNLDWAKMPHDKMPMIQVERAPFSRNKWTHVVFSFDRVNAGKAGVGKLYIDGKSQGTLENWDLTLDWKAENVMLALAASYVGHIDDLAAFNRALTDAEVRQVYVLPRGVRELH